VRPYLENTHYEKGLVEWLKVKALNSSPSTKTKKSQGGKTQNKKTPQPSDSYKDNQIQKSKTQPT
jgi:hypothetical protein